MPRGAARVTELLDLLEVSHCAERRPAEISGGEQQRVAIAVGIANSPRVLLADEPTGELDDTTSAHVLEAMRSVNRELGVTTLIVTHDPSVSEHVARTVQIRDGRTSTEVLRSTRVDEHGAEQHVAEEYAVVDRVGRLQLPDEFVTALDLRERVRLALEPDHVGVWPGRTTDRKPPAAEAVEESAAPDTDPATDSGTGEEVHHDHRPARRKLSRTFTSSAGDVHACVDIDIEVHPGELVVVRGASGAGKTTLLNLLGGLDRPTSGRVWIGEVEATALDEDALAQLRREQLGFVFQSFGLIPVLSAAENVELPLRIARIDPSERDERVAEALRLVGLADHAAQRPGELSGGQQQRVGIARAIVARPRVLIADEPTGQLDSRTATTVMDLIGELVHTQGIAAVVSTHDPLLVQRADRVVELHDGRITSESTVTDAAAADADRPDLRAGGPGDARRPRPTADPARRPARSATRPDRCGRGLDPRDARMDRVEDAPRDARTTSPRTRTRPMSSSSAGGSADWWRRTPAPRSASASRFWRHPTAWAARCARSRSRVSASTSAQRAMPRAAARCAASSTNST